MTKNIKKFALVIAFILSAAPAMAADCSDPKNYVEGVKNDVLAVLNGNADAATKKTKLNAIFLNVADVNFMGKFALGRTYSQLTPAQQKDYMAAYSEYLSASYVDKFKEYNGQNITVTGVKPNGDDFSVETSIEREGKQPIIVTYRLRKAGGCFKVGDIIAEGVSLITTERQDFASVANQKGTDGLIQTLKDKTEQYKNAPAE